jgi:predicted transcriptional regulator
MTMIPEPPVEFIESEPVQLDDDQIAELDRRWRAIEAGEATIPHEDVVRWAQTWGTPAFKPWPT